MVVWANRYVLINKQKKCRIGPAKKFYEFQMVRLMEEGLREENG